MQTVPPDCARCETYVCRKGRADLAPSCCPMQGPFPAFEELYGDASVRRLVSEAARVEAEGYCRWSRVHEIGVLAGRLGWRRLGIACGPDTRREAALAERMFLDSGLEVVMLPAHGPMEASDQADHLADAGTQLTVIAGLSVAAEAVFLRKIRTPVTSLVARDTVLQHNPAAALYTRRSYYRKKLRIEDPPHPGEEARTDLLALRSAEAAWTDRPPRCRVTEAMEWAASLGMRRLGVSFCVGLRREARTLVSILEENGFETVSICCKSGAVPKEEMGLEDAEKVRPGGPEMICNSAAQGRILSGAGVDAAFIVGQCAGHDAATLSALDPPAVVLVAKDRVYAHNTVAPLYAAGGG
ncbi:MAG: DUF1847 domain-containing protein [bacterium]